EPVTFASNEFAEGHGSAAQPACGFVRGKKIVQLVAKDRNAARLETDDGQTLVQRRLEFLHRAAQKRLCRPEKAPVIEWPSAAERLSRNGDLIAGGLEHVHRSHRRLRMKVVVEGVGPQDDAAIGRSAARRSTFAESLHKGLGRVLWHPPLRC